jgi:hypothetical protein
MFGHTLVWYRVLTLPLLLAGALLMSWSVLRLWHQPKKTAPAELVIVFSIVFMSSFANFLFVPTISYNTLTVVAAYAWVSGAFCYLRDDASWEGRLLWPSVIGSSLFLALCSRLSFGLVLIGLTLLWFPLANRVIGQPVSRGVLPGLLVASLMTSWFCAANWEAVLACADMWELIVSAQHTGLFGQYIRQSIVFGSVCGAVALLAVVVWRVHLGKWSIALVAAGVLLIGALFSSEILGLLAKHRVELVYLAVAVCVCLAALGFGVRLWNGGTGSQCVPQERLLVIISCVAVGLVSGLGTNGNVYRVAGHCMGVLALPAIMMLYDATKGFKLRKMAVLFAGGIAGLSAGLIVFLGQFHSPARYGPISLQTHSTRSPYLAHIRIERDLGLAIDRLQLALEEVGFDVAQDRLFAYPDIPGLVAVSGAESFGYPWTWTGYPDVDRLNCWYITRELDQDFRRVYLLLGEELTGDLRDCVDNALEELPGKREIFIGNIVHYRNLREYRLDLSGPFGLSKTAAKKVFE